MLRLGFHDGLAMGQLFADAFATGDDERLRFVSCAGNKESIKALDRLLHSGDNKRHEKAFIHANDYSCTPARHWPAKSVKCRTFLREIDDSTMQLVAIAEECDTGKALLAGNRTMEEALYLMLQRTLSVPLLPEWGPQLLARFQAEGNITPWRAEGTTPQGADVNTDNGDAIVSQMLSTGQLQVPIGNDAPDIDVTTVKHMDSYMRHFGRALGEHMATTALHTPGTATPPQTLRKLFPAQADAAEAMVKTWRSGEKAVWMVGEQGVGKTLIGLAAAWKQIGEKPGRILVHCPGHLVPKWTREAEQTIPGVRVMRVRHWHDALHAVPELHTPPQTPEVWIIGRDSAKLGWNWKLAAARERREGLPPFKCPSCGAPIIRKRKDGVVTILLEDNMRTRSAQNAKCQSCGESLWQPDLKGPRRIPPSKLWAKMLPAGTFDVLLADEIHEEKGDSIQGHSIGRLIRVAKRTGMLTGTLIGGKASDMYWHLQRTQPERMREYGFSGLMQFVKSYGVTEQRIFRQKTSTSERPGIHPALYGDWLLGRAVFLELQDIETHLPPYEEEVHIIPMDDKQKEMVDYVAAKLGEAVSAALKQGQRKTLGTFVQAALAYPDRVWSPNPIKYAGSETAPFGTYPDRLLPKETAIAAAALREKANGRRSVIFAEFTNTYDITHRLKNVLEDQGLSVALLTKDVPGEQREAWIAAHKEDVLICHPRLVATGLDLLEFPTIIWAQNGWSLFTMRQASRRSWRIGQTEPVKVMFFAYEDTMQQTALQLMAEKMLASQAIEGRFSAEGLQALAEGSNTTLRLAQALAFGLTDLTDLSEVWRQATDEIAEVEIAAESSKSGNSFDTGFEWPVIPMPHPDMRAIARASLHHRRSTQHPDQLALFG